MRARSASRRCRQNAAMAGKPGSRAEAQARYESQAQALADKTQQWQASQAAVAEMNEHCRTLEQRVQGLSETLAQARIDLSQETESRKGVEAKADELASLRMALEAELAQRAEADVKSREQRAEAQARYETQAQALADKTQQWEASQAAVAEMNEHCRTLEQRVQGLSETLAQARIELSKETESRKGVEAKADELAALRLALEAELAQRAEADVMSREEHAEAQARYETQAQALADKTQQWEASQAAVAEMNEHCRTLEQRVQGLSETLAQARIELSKETESRKGVEAKADELAALRLALEAELAQRAEADVKSRQERAEAQARYKTQAQALADKTQQWQASQAAVAEMNEHCRTLEQRVQGLSETLAQARIELSKETESRKGVEAKADELAALRLALEAELAQRAEADVKSRQERAEAQARYKTQAQALADKTQQWQASQAAVAEMNEHCRTLEQRVQGLSETLAQARIELSQETESRKAVEAKAAELAAFRRSLEAELAEREEAEAQWRQERAEAQAQALATEHGKLAEKTQQWQAVTDELSAARSLIEGEALQRRKLASRIIELERAKAELTEQLNTGRVSHATQLSSIQSLESQLQQRRAEIEQAERLLRAMTAEQRRVQLQAEDLRAQLCESSERLAEKVAAEQSWKQHEAELEGCVRKHRDQIGNSVATISMQEVEIRNTRQKLAEQRVIQSALCAKIRKLITASGSLAKNVQELQAQAKVSQQFIQDGQKELAGLRYAILEAWRLGAQISKDRVEALRHDAVSLTRTVATLSSTSLSTAQRGLANWLQSSVESWVDKQAETLSCLQIQVERPVFQEREFDFMELMNGVFKAIQATSVKQDFVAQTSIVGEAPGQVRGDDTHIHQLLTMMTGSVGELVDLRRLELRVSVESSGLGPDALTAQLVLATDGDANEVRAHLAGITAVSGTLQGPLLAGAESNFAACWQMAHAMGGLARFEAAADREIRISVMLPIAIVPQWELAGCSHVCPATLPASPNRFGLCN
jgi:chromosome segregation ATPase